MTNKKQNHSQMDKSSKRDEKFVPLSDTSNSLASGSEPITPHTTGNKKGGFSKSNEDKTEKILKEINCLNFIIAEKNKSFAEKIKKFRKLMLETWASEYHCTELSQLTSHDEMCHDNCDCNKIINKVFDKIFKEEMK